MVKCTRSMGVASSFQLGRYELWPSCLARGSTDCGELHKMNPDIKFKTGSLQYFLTILDVIVGYAVGKHQSCGCNLTANLTEEELPDNCDEYDPVSGECIQEKQEGDKENASISLVEVGSVGLSQLPAF